MTFSMKPAIKLIEKTLLGLVDEFGIPLEEGVADVIPGLEYALTLLREEEKRTAPDELFLAFYNAYPRKVGKPNALKAWKKFKVDAELAAKIMASLEAHKSTRQWQNKEYIPHPATWLNQERWNDEVASTTALPTNDKYAGI